MHIMYVQCICATVSPLVQHNVRFWWSLQHPLVGTPLGRVTSYVTVFVDLTLFTLTEEWYMVAIGDATHQSPQSSSCVPCSPTLNAPLIWARRDGENQQLHCDRSHQQAGWSPFRQTVEASGKCPDPYEPLEHFSL